MVQTLKGILAKRGYVADGITVDGLIKQIDQSWTHTNSKEGKKSNDSETIAKKDSAIARLKEEKKTLERKLEKLQQELK